MSAPVHPRRIETNLNLTIAAAAFVVSLFCLWLASHASQWWVVAVAALTFSFTNNTLFSLHHEAVHGLLHPNRATNEWLGRFLAATFPTIFTIQRVSHLGHHRRNRSDEELYDSYLPHQSWLLKTYWLYCLLTGFYWAIIPVAGLVYVLWPWTFRARWFQNGPARWWGFQPFVEDIASQPVGPVWREGVLTVAVQLTIILALDLTLAGWLCCYWAFGLNWSSVQYTDHADSPRHVTEGAWNLRFTRISQGLFLNYNFHLVHHRNPAIPWHELPGHVKPEDPNPSFWPIYLRLWLGAKPAQPHLMEKPR